MIKVPSWNWIPIDVPDLLEIQKELQPLIDPTWQEAEGLIYSVDLDKIKSISPRYSTLLKNLGLFDRWHYTAIVVTNKSVPYNIHRDSEYFENRCIAFNIPLINCHQSYTVWYQMTGSHKQVRDIDNDPAKSDAIYYDDESAAVEIDRMPADTCAFINVYTPHRPVTYHENFRAVLTTRFYPEIFDYFPLQK